MRTELIEGGVEEAGSFFRRHQLAVDVEADAAGFVPHEGEMKPLVRLGDFGKLDADARAAQVDVGDEGVEAVAVPVDAKPDHVPTGVIGETDAEDGELGFVERIARAPEE